MPEANDEVPLVSGAFTVIVNVVQTLALVLTQAVTVAVQLPLTVGGVNTFDIPVASDSVPQVDVVARGATTRDPLRSWGLAATAWGIVPLMFQFKVTVPEESFAIEAVNVTGPSLAAVVTVALWPVGRVTANGWLLPPQALNKAIRTSLKTR